MSTQDTGERTILRGAAVTRAPSLLRSEVLRIRSRRFVRLLVALGFVILLVAGAIAFFASARTTPEQTAAAERLRDEQVASCLADPTLPVEAKPGACSPDNYPLEYFLAKRPFAAAEQFASGATATAVGFAALLFLVGVTAGGAEWAAKTMSALLFWEPRRVRVVLVKLAVVMAVAVLVAVVAQLVWVGIAALASEFRGTWEGRAPDFLTELVGVQARGVLLGALAAAGGFALAMIVRSTGAALGIAFVYLAVVENAVRGFVPRARPFLLGENVAALLNPAGSTPWSTRSSPATAATARWSSTCPSCAPP